MSKSELATIVKNVIKAPVGLVKVITGADLLVNAYDYASRAERYQHIPNIISPPEALAWGRGPGFLAQNLGNGTLTVAGLIYSGIIAVDTPALVGGLVNTLAACFYVMRLTAQYAISRSRKDLEEEIREGNAVH